MNYDRRMIRRLVLVFVTAVAFALVIPSAPGHADPAPACNFRISPPQVVQVSSTNMVTATVEPADCGVPAQPTLSVACVQMQGSDSAPKCTEASGYSTARIYFAPYRPGATYVATGRGCAMAGNALAGDALQRSCQTTGPLTATL